ncbi:MAG: DUF3887 domain-containing protein [Phascolarctobacterium sp.]|nr:DUF3887 domain-containing protein [Phascolarctobacterium sp.]
MKKLLIMMIVSCLMMLCSVSFAADDHKALGKQQQVAERIMDAFDGEPVPLYAQVSAGFSANMKKAVTEEAFAELQKQVKQKFGTMKEAKFFTFQRFDQADRVTYIASFTKEKIVSMIFAFDKQNKLVDFAFTPVQQPEAKK